jgi:hypothetical protein
MEVSGWLHALAGFYSPAKELCKFTVDPFITVSILYVIEGFRRGHNVA